MRRRVHTRGSNRGKGHKPSTHAPATRDGGGKPAADAGLHGGGAVLSPSQAQARLAQAQAQAARRVERKLDFAAVADDAEREAEPCGCDPSWRFSVSLVTRSATRASPPSWRRRRRLEG